MEKKTNANHEIDRITEGLDIFFWIFNDPSSYVSTHWHTAIEIHYVLEGGVDIYLPNQTYNLKAGDIALIDSTVLHSIRSINGNKAILIQIPYPILARYIPNFDEILFSFDYKSTAPEVVAKKKALIKIINRMKKLFEEKPDGGMLKFNSLIFDLMYHLYHDFSHPKDSEQILLEKKSFDRIKTIMKYTNDHYNEPISIPEIASIVALNEDYFCHFFKKNLGITYLQYLNELRMSHIHQDLLSTDIPLNELLDRHGFTNYKVFRRMFLEQFGTTPAQYRKVHKK
ncbi:AraC family transcriptional regulator [Pseudobutyrivibrio sp.]